MAVLCACAGLILGATVAHAQASSPDSASAHGLFAPAFSRSDVHVLEGFAVAAAVAFPLDEWINRQAQTPSLHGTGTGGISLDVGRVALPGAYIAGYALYGTGILGGREGLADAGFHTLASVIVASHLGDLLKAGFGRARPYASSDAERYAWGSSLHSAQSYSLPSGHATAAFAAASALAEELDRGRPGAARILNPMLYATAGIVAASRVYGEYHWASDVVAGAALGTFTSRALVRAAHAHRHNLLDRAMVHGLVTVDNAGRTLLGFSSGQ